MSIATLPALFATAQYDLPRNPAATRTIGEASRRSVSVNRIGADTELGNYRTLGKCHLARRSLECPLPSVIGSIIQWPVT